MLTNLNNLLENCQVIKPLVPLEVFFLVFICSLIHTRETLLVYLYSLTQSDTIYFNDACNVQFC